jgi:hypothetical protein
MLPPEEEAEEGGSGAEDGEEAGKDSDEKGTKSGARGAQKNKEKRAGKEAAEAKEVFEAPVIGKWAKVEKKKPTPEELAAADAAEAEDKGAVKRTVIEFTERETPQLKVSRSCALALPHAHSQAHTLTLTHTHAHSAQHTRLRVAAQFLSK